jgi:hypothetical protein
MNGVFLGWLDDQFDLRDFHRVPMAVGDLVFEIAEWVTVP